MKIAVVGATGLIGSKLVEALIREGHQVRLLVRTPTRYQGIEPDLLAGWDVLSGPPPVPVLQGVDAVFNLAGESIAGGRWTAERKASIRNSRTAGTRNLVEGLRRCSSAPAVLINASAVGFYGDCGSRLLTEASPPGSGFLPELCLQWEQEAEAATALGTRVALIRTGVVLSAEGGMLARILPVFRLALGGRLGSGRQYMSWIHIEDQIRILLFALKVPVAGPLNAVAPGAVTNAEFTSLLGRRLKRPTLFAVPAAVLKCLYGEMAQALLLEGQRVTPRKAEQAGYRFSHPDLTRALENLLP